MQFFGYVLALFLIAAIILWLSDRISDMIWKHKNPPEKIKAQQEEYNNRLLQPDWSFYEKHLMRPVPESLKRIYANKKLILSEVGVNFDGIYINSFSPIDEKGLLETKEWVTEDLVAIATADGDQIYLRPGENEDNSVYITFHDGGETEIFSPNIDDFLYDIESQYCIELDS